MDTNFSVLQVCLSDGWGGLEQYPLSLAEPFARQGVAVYYWAFAGTSFAQKAQEQGYEVELFSSRFSILLNIRRLVVWIKEKKIQAIHFHKSTDVRIAYLLRLFLPDVCLVFTEHMNAKKPKKSIFHRLIYSKLDYVIAISEHTRANNLKALPIPENKLIQIYTGINLNRFVRSLDEPERQRLRSELGVSEECIAIALPGRITIDKRQDVFLKSFEKLKGKVTDKKIKAIIIGGLSKEYGSDEPAVKNLQEIIDRSCFKNDIVLTDYRDDMHQVMQAMDIVCIPSREEPFGLVVVEAMALSLPVVGSDSGAIPEILGRNAEFGLLAKPNDPQSFADKLYSLIDDPDLRAGISKRALRRVEDEFDLERHILKLMKIYFYKDRLKSV